MTRNQFIELPEWQKLVATMQRFIETAKLDALNASDFAGVRFAAGYVEALHTLIHLPERILDNGEPKPSAPPEAEGAISLPRHPHSNAGARF